LQLDVLYNEDCLEGMKRLPDHSIDCIISDLPYGTTACKWDSVIPFEPRWAQYKRIAKKNAAIVLTAGQPFTTALIGSNLAMFKYCWVWDKKNCSGFANARRAPLRAHEDVAVFSAGTIKYRPQMVSRTTSELKRFSRVSGASKPSEHAPGMVGYSPNRTDNELKFPSSVIRINGVFNRSAEKAAHPTQKPVALFEYLIRTYTNEGETVLDSCVGSGTTPVACMNTNRHYIGFEKDPGYFAIAQKRIADHKPQLSLTA
jgi:site-specific DNA-methyltransferase (adenine-specific)